MNKNDDYLYELLYKENLSLLENLHCDSKNLERIKKSSQKILLDTQKIISEKFPEVINKWTHSQPNDPHGFELIRLFIHSEEYEDVHNFSYSETESQDIHTQFIRFIKKLNRDTFHRHAHFCLADHNQLTPEEVCLLVDLVNHVYDISEFGLWKKEKVRVTLAEMTQYISNEEVYICRFKHKIVGCIRLNLLHDAKSEFGMLAVDPQFRGFGIGKRLIRLVEMNAADLGCSKMQLEVFDSQNFPLPEKVFLRQWYRDLGYQYLSNRDAYSKYEWLTQKSLVSLKLELWERFL